MRKDEIVKFRIDGEFKNLLIDRANSVGLSLSGFLVSLVEAELGLSVTKKKSTPVGVKKELSASEIEAMADARDRKYGLGKYSKKK